MRLDVALMGVIGYFLLSIHTFISAKILGEFRLSYMAGGPTELRLMLMAMTIAMPIIGGADIKDTNFSAFDLFALVVRSEEHTSELQSLMRISYAVFCLKKKTIHTLTTYIIQDTMS